MVGAVGVSDRSRILEGPLEKSRTQPIPLSISRDRQQSMDRYAHAETTLRKALQRGQNRWKSVEIPSFGMNEERLDEMQLLDRVNTILDTQRSAGVAKSYWEQCKRVIQSIFTATSPFATTFLTMARNGSSVNLFKGAF